MGILTMISQATKRMENLIEDLLSFSRAGKSFIQKEAVNLNELVEEILQDYSAETKDRQIQWIIHPLGAVEADRGLLRLVFGKLISNALKLTRARTKPKIEIGCLPNRDAEEVIFIRDNRAGFDPNQTDSYLASFSACIVRKSLRVQVLDWPISTGSFFGTAERSGPKGR